MTRSFMKLAFASAALSAAGVLVGCSATLDPNEDVASSEEAQSTDVGARIVSCAESDLGTRVGGGQCTDLVNAAMSCAQACPAPQTYVWGSREAAGVVRVGDIIQFTSVTTVTHSGNSTSTTKRGDPNHTAIVETVNGTVYGLLEQNMNGSPTQRGTFDTRTVTGGTFVVYRADDCSAPAPTPIPPPPVNGAAIAFSSSTHASGFAYGTAANQAALRYCEQSGAHDCAVAIVESSGCVALWAGSSGFGTGNASTLAQANSSAQAFCGKYSSGCVHVSDVCANGTH